MRQSTSGKTIAQLNLRCDDVALHANHRCLSHLHAFFFQNEYLGLVDQCMLFACELMDLCRGTQEVEAVLSEGGERNGSRDPLARLKMALEYEEKRVFVVFSTFAVVFASA
jgi:hypothetical protein